MKPDFRYYYCETHDQPTPCQRCLQIRRRKAQSNLAAPSGSASGIEKDVCRDIAARQLKGVEKYGVTVADNPLPLKAWLQHAYEETLDKAIYLKRAIREMENNQVRPVSPDASR